MQHIPEHDPLQDAPLLRSIRREDPFRVPDGFFERFPHLVQERINQQPPELFGRFRIALVRRSMTFASVVLVIGVVAWLVARSPDMQPTTKDLVHRTEFDIAPEELFLVGDGDISLLEDLDPSAELLSEVGTGLSDDELVAYLEQDDLPVELLIEEL